MRVYLGTSEANGGYARKLAGKIGELIKDRGYRLISLKNDGSDLERVLKLDGDEWVGCQKQIIEKIRKADVCVFEVSAGDLSIGFWVWSALSMGKAVILLGKSEKVLALFGGIGPSSMITVVYKDSDLKEKLDLALKQAGTLVNTRFNLFIPRELMAYLDWVAKNLGVNRSEYIRKLIEKEVRRRK